MAGERIAWATALALCGMLYLVWGEWLLWVLLATVLGLPAVSLVLSLPAIEAFHTEPSGPKIITQGERGTMALLGRCSRPVPPFRGRLTVRYGFTGKRSRYRPERGIPTGHCGCLYYCVEKARVCDYLGLFAFPVRNRGEALVTVRPRPISAELPPERRGPPGQRTGEEELRPYRPGDSLKAIHWKISARTEKLTFRERQLHSGLGPRVRLELSGSPDELDRKLGLFLGQGQHYMENDVPFLLEAVTGEGSLLLWVRSGESLYAALDRLLCAAPMTGGRDG